MMTIILAVCIIIGAYLVIGMAGVMVWEIVVSVKGACSVPTWLDNVYYFIIEKMFFFFK